MNTSVLILIPLIALFGGVLLQLGLGRLLTPAAKGWLALASGLVALVSLAFLAPEVWRQGSVSLTLFNWDMGISLAYRIDGLSLVFQFMAAGIGSAILLYCIGYMAHEAEGTTRFYALMLTFIAGMINLVGSANLLVAYVSWELIGLCSYFLVGFWYKQQAAAQGARKVLLITHLAGYGFLIGILLLYVRGGSFLWNDPALQAVFTTGPFLLLLLAAAAKSVLFPLHTWIPEAMNAPTPVSALLHSACYVKAGVYIVARMYSISPWHPAWNTLLMVLGVLTMLVGAVFALAQTDLKRLLAFSTISQLGHILTAFALGTPLGILTGIFYTLSHGLFKGTLFLCAGSVQHAAGTRDMRQLGGLASRMPVTAAIWLVGAAAIVGVPLGNGFVAKWLLLDSALSAGQAWVVLVAWLVSVLTAFYMLKATAGVFFGELPSALAKRGIHDADWTMKTGMGILGGLCLVFGIAPQLLVQPMINRAMESMGFQNPLQVSWLGVHTPLAGAPAITGMMLVLAASLAGMLAFVILRPRGTAAVGGFTGGDPLPSPDSRLNASDFTDMVETTLEPVYAYSDPDPLFRWGWRAVFKFSTSMDRWITPAAENKTLIATLAMAALVAVLVWLA